MSRLKEIFSLVIGDFLAVNGAWFLFIWVRLHSGWFMVPRGLDVDVIPSSIGVYLFWVITFMVFGLYRAWYVRPIFDEVLTILKMLSFGIVGFMLVVLSGPSPLGDRLTQENDTRLLAALYFCCISVLLVGERLLVRFAQRRLLESGIGLRTTIIVGEFQKALQLARRVARTKRLGYDVVGYVSATNGDRIEDSSELRLLGTDDKLEKVIEERKVKEVLIALDSSEHDHLLALLGRLSAVNVGLKIVPDLYDIISGQARTREIYGFPLIDVNPEIMRPWEEVAKRVMDISICVVVLVLGMPVWLLIALAVRLSSPGPVIYSQERVGRNGVPFKIYKFRSMTTDAEKGGPQWAQKNDPRVTSIGRFLRKSHLDEVPQFWNVLIGNMSLVGPRPERSFFVEQLSQQIPYYRRRLRVRPGITSLYQATIDKYDETMDDVRNKLKYDLMYIESMSFRLDLKILFRTAYVMLKGKGQA